MWVGQNVGSIQKRLRSGAPFASPLYPPSWPCCSTVEYFWCDLTALVLPQLSWNYRRKFNGQVNDVYWTRSETRLWVRFTLSERLDRDQCGFLGWSSRKCGGVQKCRQIWAKVSLIISLLKRPRSAGTWASFTVVATYVSARAAVLDLVCIAPDLSISYDLVMDPPDRKRHAGGNSAVSKWRQQDLSVFEPRTQVPMLPRIRTCCETVDRSNDVTTVT